MFFYYIKLEIQKGKLYCVYQSEIKLTQEQIEEVNKYQPNLLDDTIVYEGLTPFLGYPIIQGDTIRPATEKELVDLGIITLKEGEILEGDNIKKVPQPSWQYKWESPNWVIDDSKLQDGEIIENGAIKTVPIPTELFIPKWVRPNWIENATDEEKENIHNQLIDNLKSELLEDGYIYSDKAKTTHQQKCRDKDLAYLGNAIASMQDASIPTMKWYFNNGDMLELTLEEIKGLRTKGALFVSNVFNIEAKLKEQTPTKNLTLIMFKDEVDKISEVKCFRPTV